MVWCSRAGWLVRWSESRGEWRDEEEDEEEMKLASPPPLSSHTQEPHCLLEKPPFTYY